MICPVEIARDLSAFRAVRVGDHAKHGFLLEGRDGAGDESTGSDLTGDGETGFFRLEMRIHGMTVSAVWVPALALVCRSRDQLPRLMGGSLSLARSDSNGTSFVADLPV